MKLIYKRVSLFVLIFLVLVGNRVECLFIIPSILMAMGSGLLMGKMTMGGLLMMLMAANQQQQGQSFLRSLGIVPHASSNGILVPTIHSNEVQDLIVRRKRDTKNDPKKFTGGPFINEQVQYRIMRQVANSDPLSCLPQTLCGISASPPSTQSGILNDYAYLLKTVFSRDEDLDDLDSDFEGLKTNKKNKTKTATSNKKKDKVQDDESSEEEEADDEEVEEQRRKDAFELEDLANEELLGTEPAYIPFALKNSYQHSKRGPPQRPMDLPPPSEPFEGIPPGGLEGMTETELDEMLARLGGPQSPPPRPNGGGSLLSNLMPKLSLGFTPGKGDKFDDDPFFSGFKRSVDSGRSVEYDVNVRPATAEEEELFQEMRQRRRQRKEYIAAKRQELAKIKDPVEKFRIAVEFGERIKSPRQCRLLFNNCPFNYTQVLGMVADMRKVLMGQPLNEPQRDTVVDLKPVNAKPASVINLNAGVNSRGGVTSIIQELPTGEKVEINLKMTKTGLQQTRKTIKPNSTLPSSNIAARPTDPEQVFDDAIPQSNNSSAIPLKDLESLKATVMALEKINALSAKKTQPISYSEVLSKLKKQTSPKVNLQYINTAKKVKGVSDLVASPTKKSVITKLDDNTDNSDNEPKPTRKSNSPKKTASFLATLSKVEDDEADDNVAQSFSNVGTKLSTNMKLEQLLIKLKEQNGKKTVKPSNKSPEVSEEDDYEDGNEEDDEEEVGYKSNLHVMDDDQTALSSSRSIMVTQIPPHINIRKQSPLIRHTIMRRRGLVRKPKKLFLGYDKELPRDLPS